MNAGAIGGTDGRPLSLFMSPNNPPQREFSATLLETCDAVSQGSSPETEVLGAELFLSNRTV